jgi:hypothetical protein
MLILGWVTLTFNVENLRPQKASKIIKGKATHPDGR